jgi:protein involved in ribonucleotide reduction
MLCGVINGLNLVVTGLDVQIDNLLALGTSSTSDNPNQIFTDSSGTCGANYTPQSGPDSGKKLPVCDAYYAGWQSFRDIALGLLVIVGLIIVISQALGMEILDAYTIRKMLPRVLLATIAITLSWQLMRLLVTLSNDLGYGVRSLMSTPFSRLGINLNLSTGGSLLAALATAAGLAIFDLFAILTFVGTAAIAVLVTFLVLILRQIVVILLIIFSPIALIAYVLPNTQRVYKFWWESFSKMLLMFPMIVALIAAGHIFAAIAANQGTDFVHQTIAVIAYFAPYFMVPMTFRFSGGIMSGLGNAVNARGDGARGYLRKRRGEAVQGRMNAWKSGEVVKNKYVPKGVRTALNTTGKGLGTGFRGHFGLGQRGKEAMGFVDQTARDEALQSASMKAIKGKNDFNRILAEANGDERQGRKALYDHLMRGGDDGRFLEQFGTREEAAAAAQTKVEQAAVAARATGGFTKARATAGFYNMAQDGTAIRDEKDLARLAAVVGGGNGNNTYTYAAEGAELSKRAGRPDLKPDTEQIGNLAFQQSDKIYNGGQARLYSGGQSEDKLVTTAKLSAYGNTQAYERFTSARGRALRNEHSFLAEVVSDSTGKYTAEEKQQAAAHIADAKNAIASGQGAVNKLGAAATALAPADIAYERYMGREAGRDNGIQFSPGQRSPAAQYSNKDEVEAAYGGDQRYGNRTLTDAQRAEEANRNQPPPEQQ